MRAYRGFSLLEVLVALFILSVGVMAVMELFPHALSQVRLATERVPLTAEANEALNVLRAQGMQFNTNVLENLNAAANAYGDTAEMRRFNVQPVGMPGPLHQEAAIYALYRVSLSIPMPDGREEKFVTYISKY